MTSRRYKTFQPCHEDIIELYVKLSVDLKYNARDGLNSFKIMTQNSHVPILEKVLVYYCKITREKISAAQEESAKLGADVEVKEEEDDDEQTALLSALVSGDNQELADKQVLNPWLKYMWDVYRTVLEILKNNIKLEDMYHTVAREALEFCLEFKRNHTFRRLCETMRNHLTQLAKYSHQSHSIDLKNPETQTRYLQTRFLQLKIASELEMWQDAYRTIEDIHASMSQSHAEPEAALMVTYYEKLAQIFWASENYLFHAYSLEQVAALQVVAEPNLDEETRRQNADRVLLATVSIPATSTKDDEVLFDQMDEGNMRLARLLGFKKGVPTRSHLLDGLKKAGLIRQASESTARVYRILEKDFGPLSMHANLSVEFKKFAEDTHLAKYIAPLERLTVVRLLQQLSRVFRTIRLEKFYKLAPAMHAHEIERLIVQAVRDNLVAVRLHHHAKMIHFSEDRMDAKRIKSQLAVLASRLQAVVDTIHPVDEKSQEVQREHVFSAIAAGVHDEHIAVFERQQIIEKRKEENERDQQEKKRIRDEQRRAAEAKRVADEKARLIEESRKRDEERAKKEAEEKLLQEKLALAEQIEKKLQETMHDDHVEKATKKIEELTKDIENIDREDLIKAQAEILEQEAEAIKRQGEEKARRNDYLIRAIRDTERDALREHIRKTVEEEKTKHAEQYQAFLKQQKQRHAIALAEKKRLARMSDPATIFREKVMARRREEYEAAHAAQVEKLEQAREERRIANERRQKEEEEKRAEAERLRIIAEKEAAEERTRKEALQRAEAERAERLASRGSRYQPPVRGGDRGDRGDSAPPSRPGWGSRGSDRSESYGAPRGGDRFGSRGASRDGDRFGSGPPRSSGYGDRDRGDRDRPSYGSSSGSSAPSRERPRFTNSKKTPKN